jgi:hypothetical protein
MLGNYRVASQLVTSRVVLGSIDSVFLLVFLGWGKIESTSYVGHCTVLYCTVQAPAAAAAADDDDYGVVGGMIGRENRSTRRKSAPAPLVRNKFHMT